MIKVWTGKFVTPCPGWHRARLGIPISPSDTPNLFTVFDYWTIGCIQCAMIPGMPITIMPDGIVVSMLNGVLQFDGPDVKYVICDGI
jgi:hypothetical protein